MKYHIKDIFGNYKTYDSPSHYTFFELILTMTKSLIFGVGGALLVIFLFYLFISFILWL